MKIKTGFTLILTLTVVVLSLVNKANAQAIKINLPTTIIGTPNLGAEFTVSQRFTINGDVLWAPYMFKKSETVFRVLAGTAEFRYYVNPKYYYTNNMFDGFYLGPYAMFGNFNIGIDKGHNNDEVGQDESKKSYRYSGWGVSSGVSLGYKFYLSKRLRMDVNMGLGYAHIQYDKYLLGGEWAGSPLSIKDTKAWIGPTKFGVHLVYNIFR